jgi:hypothetical protein
MVQKLNQNRFIPPRNELSQSFLDTQVKVSRVARPLLTPVAHNCVSANVVYSWAERVFILEQYISSKSSASVLEAFSSACSDKYRLIRKFRNSKHVRCRAMLTGESLRSFEETLRNNWFVFLYSCHESLQCCCSWGCVLIVTSCSRWYHLRKNFSPLS